MPFTQTLCPACLRMAQSPTVHPNADALILLGVDHVPGDGPDAVTSRHYACMNCRATWKVTARPRQPGDASATETWELIDSPD